jgi:hypothetical protein
MEVTNYYANGNHEISIGFIFIYRTSLIASFATVLVRETEEERAKRIKGNDEPATTHEPNGTHGPDVSDELRRRAGKQWQQFPNDEFLHDAAPAATAAATGTELLHDQ